MPRSELHFSHYAISKEGKIGISDIPENPRAGDVILAMGNEIPDSKKLIGCWLGVENLRVDQIGSFGSAALMPKRNIPILKTTEKLQVTGWS